MDFCKSFLLGLVQGLSEFLPVSSSGHLVLGQKFFNLAPPIFFDILVHLGTLLAIVFYFFRDFKRLKSGKVLSLLLVGSLPAGIIGLFLRTRLEIIFSSYFVVGFSFLISALLLFLTKFLKNQKKEVNKISFSEAFLIGGFQALALLPGVSRSGSTIVAGLLVGLKRKEAFTFSFFLSIPAILGALFLEILRGGLEGQTGIGLIGMLSAFFSGLLALRILQTILKKGKLFYFGFYCFALGVLILILG